MATLAACTYISGTDLDSIVNSDSRTVALHVTCIDAIVNAKSTIMYNMLTTNLSTGTCNNKLHMQMDLAKHNTDAETSVKQPDAAGQHS